MDELVLDNTKRSSFSTCRRKYYWQHVRGLQPITGSSALRFGSTWHGAMEGFYSHVRENGWTRDGKALQRAVDFAKAEWDACTKEHTQWYDDYRTLENCLNLFLLYMNHYAADHGMLEVIDTERVFRLPMLLSLDEISVFPHLEKTNVFFTGQIDLRVKLNGMIWIMEHKTTGQTIDLQAGRLNRSAQIKGYTYASIVDSEHKAEGCLMSFAQIVARKTKSGDYGSLTTNFMRHPQIFSNEDLSQWRNSFLAVCNDIAFEHERNLWPCNDDSCYQFGACPYIGLCEQNRRDLNDTITDNYMEKFWDVEARHAAKKAITAGTTEVM